MSTWTAAPVRCIDCVFCAKPPPGVPLIDMLCKRNGRRCLANRFDTQYHIRAEPKCGAAARFFREARA